MKASEQAKKALTHTSVARKLTDADFISTGITLLNLATHGRVFGGMTKGMIYRLIGRSQTAKSFLARTILAEAAYNSSFNDYQLIHDDIEHGVHMDDQKFFGAKAAARIRAPGYEKKTQVPIFSSTISSFYDVLLEKLKKGEKFIWVVDSQDSLKADEKTKMSDGKAKVHANYLREALDLIEQHGCILILVHHAKVNMGFSWGGDVTTGGMSPEYYSSLDIRLSKLGAIKKTVGEKKFPIGNNYIAHVTKNRLIGSDRTIKFPLMNEIGIDDVGACVDYLCEFEKWKKTKGIITAPELNFEGTRTKVCKEIEKRVWERELRLLTGKVWHEIEAACKENRKARYPQ